VPAAQQWRGGLILFTRGGENALYAVWANSRCWQAYPENGLSGHDNIAGVHTLWQSFDMYREIDIQQRLPVWTVLSELFLDTSFDDADYDRIAAELIRSPYRPTEIEQILRNEVSPAFAGNLFSVADEWTRWSEEEVKEIMERWLVRQSAKSLITRIKARLTLRMVPPDWYAIAARLAVR